MRKYKNEVIKDCDKEILQYLSRFSISFEMCRMALKKLVP
jgi:hypothetical protein